ncbi:MAG: hypothetical protein ACPGWM_09195 [Flavobacteriales bacterium]
MGRFRDKIFIGFSLLLAFFISFSSFCQSQKGIEISAGSTRFVNRDESGARNFLIPIWFNSDLKNPESEWAGNIVSANYVFTKKDRFSGFNFGLGMVYYSGELKTTLRSFSSVNDEVFVRNWHLNQKSLGVNALIRYRSSIVDRSEFGLYFDSDLNLSFFPLNNVQLIEKQETFKVQEEGNQELLSSQFKEKNEAQNNILARIGFGPTVRFRDSSTNPLTLSFKYHFWATPYISFGAHDTVYEYSDDVSLSVSFEF